MFLERGLHIMQRLIPVGFALVLCLATDAFAQEFFGRSPVYSTYYPVMPLEPVIYGYAPAPVTAYYAPPVVSYYSTYSYPYAVAPYYVVPRPYVVRQKIYYRGQPVRNFFRALGP